MICSRASKRRIRGTPTRPPNSPRDKSVGELRPKLPSQSENASKSKVRQTVGLEFIGKVHRILLHSGQVGAVPSSVFRKVPVDKWAPSPDKSYRRRSAS